MLMDGQSVSGTVSLNMLLTKLLVAKLSTCKGFYYNVQVWDLNVLMCSEARSN